MKGIIEHSILGDLQLRSGVQGEEKQQGYVHVCGGSELWWRPDAPGATGWRTESDLTWSRGTGEKAKRERPSAFYLQEKRLEIIKDGLTHTLTETRINETTDEEIILTKVKELT